MDDKPWNLEYNLKGWNVRAVLKRSPNLNGQGKWRQGNQSADKFFEYLSEYLDNEDPVPHKVVILGAEITIIEITKTNVNNFRDEKRSRLIGDIGNND